MLDLTFSPEQEMLRETVRGVCAATCPLSVVRELEDDPVGFSPELWKQLAHLDLIGLQLPEEYGGSGMSVVEGVVVYEEFGQDARPHPPLRERRAVRHGRSPPPAATSSSRRGSRPSSPGTPSSPRRGSSPRAASARPACRPAPFRTVRASPSAAPNATCPSPPRPPGCWCWPEPVTSRATSTCSSSTPAPRGSP